MVPHSLTAALAGRKGCNSLFLLRIPRSTSGYLSSGSRASAGDPRTAEEMKQDPARAGAAPAPAPGGAPGQPRGVAGCPGHSAQGPAAPPQSSGRLQRGGKASSQELSPSPPLPAALEAPSLLSGAGWRGDQAIPVGKHCRELRCSAVSDTPKCPTGCKNCESGSCCLPHSQGLLFSRAESVGWVARPGQSPKARPKFPQIPALPELGPGKGRAHQSCCSCSCLSLHQGMDPEAPWG